MADTARAGLGAAKAMLGPGMRVLIRGEEWLVKGVEKNTLGNDAVRCVGVSELVRDREAVFLADLDDIEPIDPVETRLVVDDSPNFVNSRIYLESQLRSRVPTGDKLYVGFEAAMDSMRYQYDPALKALARPRQRILIADAVGLGKTLEAGILMSELIARGKGRRILVVTSKSMLAQFQREMWNRFTIPLVQLDSARIKRVRQQLPSNANPFYYYDKTIVSMDTLKRSSEYGVHLENAYWDIIVIDEAQNVAERGRANAARSKLAKRLAGRSDTLIMLSATPHDGRARSFASLMNMLDPTAIADPDDYTKEDIDGLYVRRFKEDVRDQDGATFLTREVSVVRSEASAAEERVFDEFAELSLHMDEGKAHGSGALFKTMLEKSLFSSPAALLETLDHRLDRLAGKEGLSAREDEQSLRGLRDAAAKVGPKDFSRYQSLLGLLRSEDYGWDPGRADDRLVVFTERIVTMRFLADNLVRDLGLPPEALIAMDGSMSDTDQMAAIDEFNSEGSPVRVLVASDVASEGINLHYFSHRLVHFDTPWSLMVFQQRNGRVDRYGQTRRPDIRFLVTDPENERVRGDARILEILIEKEGQAQKNIGDPVLLMGRFDVEEETRVIERVIEDGASEADLEKALTPPVGEGLLEILSGGLPAAEMQPISREWLQTLLEGEEYLEEGLAVFGKDSGVVATTPIEGHRGLRVQIARGTELWRALMKVMPENNIKGESIVLSPDASWCMDEVRRARLVEFEHGDWPQAQYLWALHPVFSWLRDKASVSLFGRGEAPLVGVDRRLCPGDVLFLVSGTVANRRSAPVVDKWVGVLFRGDKTEVMGLQEALRLSGIKSKDAPNTLAVTEEDVERVCALRELAVEAARREVLEERRDYEERAEVEVDRELEKLQGLHERHSEQLRLTLEGRRLNERQAEVDRVFDEYTDWVAGSLEAQDGANMKIQAAFVGVRR